MKKKASRARKTGSPAAPGERREYASLLRNIKDRIQRAQTRAVLSVNAELVRLYWDIGHMIHERQQREGWGAAVIPRLAAELKNELPDLNGFSERNIGHMIAFHREYPDPDSILQQPAAKLPVPPISPQPVAKLPAAEEVQPPPAQLPESPFWSIPWFHHVILMQKVKDLPTGRWYMEQTLADGWSRNILTMQIDAQAHARHGKAVSNFAAALPEPQSDLVTQTLKDPYIFDFLTLEEPFHERELEAGLVRHLEKFLLELGQGFAFVGRQYRLDVGKLNFYCNVVNDQLRHAADGPTIGLILCQTKNRVLAEYALSGIDKPIGVSSYELTRALPASLKSSLPTVEEIEAELEATEAKEPKAKRVAKKPAKKKRAKRKRPRSGEGE